MAPTAAEEDFRVVRSWRRAADGDASRPSEQNEGDPSSMSTYVAVGITVGSILLLGVVFLLVKIVRKRRNHKRAMEVLEAQSTDHAQNMQQAIRPFSHLWEPDPTQSLRSSAGWGLLSSSETLDQAQRKKDPKHRPIRLPRRMKQSPAIRMKDIKCLSAIVENSPTIRSSKPSPQQQSKRLSNIAVQDVQPSVTTSDDVFKPRPQTVHEIHFNSHLYEYDAARAVSIDIAKDARTPYKRLSRPLMHTRSFSLGVPPTKPPSGPVPPVPMYPSHTCEGVICNRKGIIMHRLSNESAKSTSSSVLVTSPLLSRDRSSRPSRSPTLEQTVAEDGNAELKTTRARSLHAVTESNSSRADRFDQLHLRSLSIKSDNTRFSGAPIIQSSSSPDLDDKQENRLSIPKFGTAERISISRVSSASSVKSIEASTPPRRKSPANRRVSHNGSPVERKRSTGLREISPNTMTPSRQPSVATQDSTHSSNGNPFQWDNHAVNKPSAMKGSPNARKGHRRQNCVRISTLTPQVLGPPPSRTNSPSIMHGIQEEGLDHNCSPMQTRFVTNHRIKRPASAGSFRDDLRVQTLRASLTPSSPTLSIWTASQDAGLPYDDSPRLSLPSPTRSPTRRSASRSPTRRLPAYPTPGKTTVSTILHHEGIPQLSFCQASAEGNSLNPQMYHSHVDIPSSPPLPVSKEQPYDPAWSLPAPRREYDPASPQWKAEGFPIAALRDTRSAGPSTVQSSPAAYSPGSMFDFKKIDPRKAALDILTSANADTLMAKMSLPKADFPGTPVLSPAQYSSPLLSPSSSSARRKVIIPPAQPDMSSEVSAPLSDISIPSPLHIRSASLQTSPAGGWPPPQPTKSVLNQALDLRRMNSEVDNTRWSQRYLRMGGEASPTLPWVANLRTPGDGSPSVVDFDGSEASFNGTEGECYDDRRSVRFGIMEYGSSPPVVPFQIDNRSTEEADVFVDSPGHDGLSQFEFPSPSKGGIKVLPRSESLPRRSPSTAGVTKYRKKSSPRQAAKLGTPKGILKKMPVFSAEFADQDQQGDDKENKQKRKQLGMQTTPLRAMSRTSLYDSDGFLRT